MRPRFHTITPYVILRDARRAIDFYKAAFGATEIMRMDDEDGGIRHAEIQIGDSPVMITGESPAWPDLRSVEAHNGSPVQMFLYVDHVDRVYETVTAAGATTVMPVENKSYGRTCGVKDPFGLTWWITQHPSQ
jgi:PhnB protein